MAIEAANVQQGNLDPDDLLPSSAWSSATPIVAVFEGQLSQHGTGHLFGIGEHRFLVTAAHVISQAVENGRALYITTGIPGTGGLVPIEKSLAFGATDFDFEGNDPVDVAIFRLDQETIAKLGNRTFLTTLDIARSPEPAEDLYWLHGFPSAFCPAEPNKISFLSVEAMVPTFDGHHSFPNYDSKIHVLLDCRDLKTSDGIGLSTLKGASGCAVWKTFAGLPVDQWTKGQAKVVGVQTVEYRDGQVARCTRWPIVLDLIQQIYPEVKPALQLHMPSRLLSPS